MPRRRKDKVDSNQGDIVGMLRTVPGMQVITGVDDILVGYKGVNYWFEIKDPDKCLKKDKTWRKGAVKDGQFELAKRWAGQYNIVTNLDEIFQIIGLD